MTENVGRREQALTTLTKDVGGVVAARVEAAQDEPRGEDGGEERQPRRAKSQGDVADHAAHHQGLPPEPAASLIKQQRRAKKFTGNRVSVFFVL